MNIEPINIVRQNMLGLIADILVDTPSYVRVSALHKAMNEFIKASEGDCNDKLSEGVKLLNEWFENKHNKSDIEVTLNQEHTRLFFLGKYSIGSTASYYLTETSSNKGKPRDDVVEFYRRYGYLPKRGKMFDDDSLGAELLFLSAIIVDKNIPTDIQKEFYDKHIKIWKSLFCDDLYNKCEEKTFFRAFAKIVDGYLEADREVMDIIS